MKALTDATDPDIILGTETWLNEKSSAEIFPSHISFKKIRSTIHVDPWALWLWSLFNTSCGREVFLEAPNDRFAHLEPSEDFSSGNLFSDPSQSPPAFHYTQSAILEACLLKPFKYPFLPNHAWVVLTLVSAWACIKQSSCGDIFVSDKNCQTALNLSWIYTFQTCLSTVIELQCL